MSVKLWIIFTFSIFNYQIKLHFRPECNGTMHLLQDKKFVRTEELTLDSPTALTDLSVICKVRSLVTGHWSLVTCHLSLVTCLKTVLSSHCQDGVTCGHQAVLGQRSKFLQKLFLSSSPLRTVSLLECPGLPPRLKVRHV